MQMPHIEAGPAKEGTTSSLMVKILRV